MGYLDTSHLPKILREWMKMFLLNIHSSVPLLILPITCPIPLLLQTGPLN
jgi:hypothetical protein